MSPAHRPSLLAACGFWLCAAMVHAAPLTVTDLKGRSIEIDLVSLSGDNVTFRRPGGPKEFTLAVSQFAEDSQTLIREQAASLPAPPPKLSVNVVIGKRRMDKGDSYYVKRQEVTCTVKLTNLSNANEVPPLKGKILFIGQNTRTPSLYSVLSSESFEVSLKRGETVSSEIESFSTSYDSDNKGVGNIGGFQYFGYVMALTDAAGNIVLHQTTTGSFKKALDGKPELLKQVLEYRKGAALTDKLTPSAAIGF